jgi:hypothetical protein
MYGSLIMMHFLQGRLIIVWLVFLGSLFWPHCPTPKLGTRRNGDSPPPPDNVAFYLIRGSGRSCSWLDRTLSPSLTAGQLRAENPPGLEPRHLCTPAGFFGISIVSSRHTSPELGSEETLGSV